MGYSCQANVSDRDARSGSVTVFEGDDVILSVEFVKGAAAAWDRPNPPEAAMTAAKAAFNSAVAEGPSVDDCASVGRSPIQGGTQRSMTDEELLSQLRATFPQLDRWRLVVASEVRIVEDSELAEDDRLWPPGPLSSWVLLGLGAAREHLHAVRLLVEAGELFPSAAPTLCRTALIGAALAVWMLEPVERRERRRRWLSVAYDDYSEHLKYGNQALADLSKESLHPEAAGQLARLEIRRDEVAALLAELGGRYRINLTNEVVPAALAVAVPDERLRAEMLLQWRSMSGAVHALMWHHFGQQGTTVSDLDDQHIGRVAIGGDVGRLIMSYFTAFHVARAGWSLVAQRSGVPSLAPR